MKKNGNTISLTLEEFQELVRPDAIQRMLARERQDTTERNIRRIVNEAIMAKERSLPADKMLTRVCRDILDEEGVDAYLFSTYI